MPAYSRQDVYARHLISDRGYPLWTPEPNMSLPQTYLREGLKIGDVGVVVPGDGSFDVLFNLCLPAWHPLHLEKGVPDNFTPITLGGRDVARFPEAEDAGCVISGSSVTMVKSTNAPQEDSERRAHPGPGPLNYEFTLSSSDGAVLVLPEGAEHWYLLNELPFREQAIKHAVNWYTFATRRLGRIISNDSLYVITGFYKSRSWALAAYQQRVDRGEATAQFKAVQVGAGSVMESYSWEATQGMDRRVGPSDRFYNGIPNQTVFIQGLKIAIRESLLRKKRVDVKADFPSLRRYSELSDGPWNLWSRSFSSEKSPEIPPRLRLGKADTSTNLNDLVDGQSDSIEDTAIQSFPQAGKPSGPFAPSEVLDQLLLESLSSSSEKTSVNASKEADTSTNLNDLIDGQSDSIGEDVAIQSFPQAGKPFHPSDIINQLLLEKFPRAKVAVTHDNDLIKLFARGLPMLGEPSQRSLVASMIEDYSVMRGHAVYLQPESTLAELSSKVDGMSLNNGGIGNSDIRKGAKGASSDIQRALTIRFPSTLERRVKIELETSQETYSKSKMSTQTIEIQDDVVYDLTGHVTRCDNRNSFVPGPSVVYEGRLDIKGGSIQVAIKVYKPRVDTLRQVRREIDVRLKLDHPNILPLFGITTDPSFRSEVPGLVSPRAKEGELTGYLMKNDHLIVSRRLGIANDIANGLQYLHSQQVVHGNLSGETVLVHADGSACIADFRSSRLLTDQWVLTRTDSTNMVPTVQTDVYSFGNITLQILIGYSSRYFSGDALLVEALSDSGAWCRRPDQNIVTDNRWSFVQWCWSPAKSRPSSDQLVEFTGKELAESMAAKV